MQLFFGLMALAMVGVKYKSDKRDQYLQHGGWFVKVALWVLFNILPFFFPVSFVNGYGGSPPSTSALSLPLSSVSSSTRFSSRGTINSAMHLKVGPDAVHSPACSHLALETGVDEARAKEMGVRCSGLWHTA